MQAVVTIGIYSAFLAVGFALCWDFPMIQRGIYGALIGGIGILVAHEIARLVYPF